VVFCVWSSRSPSLFPDDGRRRFSRLRHEKKTTRANTSQRTFLLGSPADFLSGRLLCLFSLPIPDPSCPFSCSALMEPFFEGRQRRSFAFLSFRSLSPVGFPLLFSVPSVSPARALLWVFFSPGIHGRRSLVVLRAAPLVRALLPAASFFFGGERCLCSQSVFFSPWLVVRSRREFYKAAFSVVQITPHSPFFPPAWSSGPPFFSRAVD